MSSIIEGGISFSPKWINDQADSDMVKFAEGLAIHISSNLTKTQFRNIYGEIKRIQSNYKNNKSSVFLLKPKVAYAVARTTNRNAKQSMQRFKEVFDIAINDAIDEKTYNNFCNFMEAILAYHRCYSKD